MRSVRAPLTAANTRSPHSPPQQWLTKTEAGPVKGFTLGRSANRQRPWPSVAGLTSSATTSFVSQPHRSRAKVRASSQSTRTPRPRSASASHPAASSSASAAALRAASRATTAGSVMGAPLPSRQGIGSPPQYCAASLAPCLANAMGASSANTDGPMLGRVMDLVSMNCLGALA